MQNNHTKAKCLLCPEIKIIQGSILSSSNFVKHLKSRHEDSYNEYLSQKKERKINSSDNVSNVQTKLMTFITSCMLPLSIVEHPDFRALFNNSTDKCCSRKTISNKLSSFHNNVMKGLNREIDANNFFCTTADIWSCKKRSFLRVTCHWIGNDLKRKSAALACHRFSGAHTFDAIAECLVDIHAKFRLDNSNIVATVTDNGSNFVKVLLFEFLLSVKLI